MVINPFVPACPKGEQFNMWDIGYKFISQRTNLKPTAYPKILRQTMPFAYRFGLNLTLPPPVVINLTFGGLIG